MTTIIEKDSLIPALIVVIVIGLILLGGALGLAYIGGVFTGKDEVLANDKRIANQAIPVSAPVVAPVPAGS